MRAYGNMIQEPEEQQGVPVLTHQAWSGANYVDDLLRMCTGGVSSTSAMGEGVTEKQFGPAVGDHKSPTERTNH